MIKQRLYDANGRWVQLDERHIISRTATGNEDKPWVFFWCGEDFISAHATKQEATKAALRWEMERVDRLVGRY